MLLSETRGENQSGGREGAGGTAERPHLGDAIAGCSSLPQDLNLAEVELEWGAAEAAPRQQPKPGWLQAQFERRLPLARVAGGCVPDPVGSLGLASLSLPVRAA